MSVVDPSDFAALCNAVAGLCDALSRLERAIDGATNRVLVDEARQKRKAAERTLMMLAERSASREGGK